MITPTPIIACLSVYFLVPTIAQPTVIEWLSGIKYVPPPTPSRQNTCRDCTIRNGDGPGEARFLFDLAPTQLQLECCPGTEPQCTCGKERPTRIVGGQEVKAGKYPWMAAVANTAGAFCGATLIASRWAITAAHCTTVGTIAGVVLGEHDISTSMDAQDGNRKAVVVEEVIPHPKFKPLFNALAGSLFGYTLFSNDIALLKLAEEVDMSVHTPACLPESGKDFTGQMGTVYGWGTIDHCQPALNPILHEASLEILSDATCEAQSGSVDIFNATLNMCEMTDFSYDGLISDDMLCAGAAGKGSCQGDSG